MLVVNGDSKGKIASEYLTFYGVVGDSANLSGRTADLHTLAEKVYCASYDLVLVLYAQKRVAPVVNARRYVHCQAVGSVGVDLYMLCGEYSVLYVVDGLIAVKLLACHKIAERLSLDACQKLEGASRIFARHLLFGVGKV